MTCEDLIIKLSNIESHLQDLHKTMQVQFDNVYGRISTYISQADLWTVKQTGKSYFYERLVTFTGTAMDIDLNLPYPSQLNRIEQIFNDTTARDFEIRIYNSVDPAVYTTLVSDVTNTGLNRVSYIEYKYETGTRIRIHYENITTGSTVRIKIQVDEL